MVKKSVVFTTVGVCPAADIPLVELAAFPLDPCFLLIVKSPKSVALPVVAISTKSQVLTLLGV